LPGLEAERRFSRDDAGHDLNALRFVRPDVAIADIDTEVSGSRLRPQRVAVGPDGVLRSRPLMALVKEQGAGWIAAHHNVWQATPAARAAMNNPSTGAR